ncbi:unnamed protein product [Absidia cylindrospora]
MQYPRLFICDYKCPILLKMFQARSKPSYKRIFSEAFNQVDQQQQSSTFLHVISARKLKLVSASDYTEMNDMISDTLNIDWTRRPWMLNCAQIHGSSTTLDVHHERTHCLHTEPTSDHHNTTNRHKLPQYTPICHQPRQQY